jgi:Ni/Fe-hydrogenase subunit HybB-like protein
LTSDIKQSHNRIMVGLARIAGGVMFVYLFLTALNFLHGQLWQHMAGGWGLWYLADIIGLVALPMVLFIAGSAQKRTGMIRIAAVLTLLGIIVNRLNISIIAFKWYAPVHYVPSIWEIVVTAGILSAEIWVFRWIVLRMPILSERPAWARKQESHESERPQIKKVAA